VTCPARYDRALDMWVVAEPDDVRRVLRDPATFRPENALTAHRPLTNRSLRILAGVRFALPPTLASNGDPASHTPIRRSIARFFGPSRVEAVEPLARALVRERLGPVAGALSDGHSVDLVAAMASDVPALVMAELLGLGGVDILTLKRWSRDSLELFWGWPDDHRQEVLAASAAEFYGWLRIRAATAREAGGSDLFGALAALGLSETEVCAAAYFVLIAGHETTTQLISAALHHVLMQPGGWAALVDAPTRAATIVEDVLASVSSVPTWRRRTARDAQVREVTIPAGSDVLVELSGNGGPADLAFGVGVHRCLGAGLARMEARAALEEAARLLPLLRPVEQTPPMVDLLSFRAPRRVLVQHP